MHLLTYTWFWKANIMFVVTAGFCNMLQANWMEMTNDFMIVHGRGLQTFMATLSHFKVTLLPSKQKAFSECLNCSVLLKKCKYTG